MTRYKHGSAKVTAIPATPDDLNRNSAAGLRQLYQTNPLAASLASRVGAILIFPNNDAPR